jgi:hypothetical protein
MNAFPVACGLSAPELRAREAGLLASVAARVEERVEIPEGLRLRFAMSDTLLQDLVELVTLERQCCPFLRFGLVVEPAAGPLWLELSGPPGTRAFLATLALGR